MQIGVTNPLRQFLGWRAFPPRESDGPLFCWDAHRVEIGGRKMLVVCNAANRFAGVAAMRAADWKRLDETCADLIRSAMLEAGFLETAVAAYLERAGEVEFGRTHGRKAMGCMNRMIDVLTWQGAERGVQFQAQLTRFANEADLCHCASREDYGYAAEWMADDLRALGIEPFGAGSATREEPAKPTLTDVPGAYEGKYAEMAAQLRADGCDERTVERFVREEAEADEWRAGAGISDFEALKKWRSLSERERGLLLGSVFCARCIDGEFAPGYAVRQDRWSIVIEGTCAKCGGPIARTCEDL